MFNLPHKKIILKIWIHFGVEMQNLHLYFRGTLRHKRNTLGEVPVSRKATISLLSV